MFDELQEAKYFREITYFKSPIMSVCQNDTTSYFSVSLKFGACYITGQWWEFKMKTILYIFI